MAKRSSLSDDDDEEMNMASTSSLLRESDPSSSSSQQQQQSIPLCGFLTVQYYKPYFDLDTDEVTNRVTTTLFYCKREHTFLEGLQQKQNPDAYGPFWISTTLIFSIAVSSHISKWLFNWINSIPVIDNNIQQIVTLASIVYGFVTFAPTVLWLFYRQMAVDAVNVDLPSLICLVGYSLFVYLPASVVCILPYQWIHWLVLLGTATTSSTLLLRNLAPLLASNNNKQLAAYLLILIGVLQFGFMLTLKVLYF